jgi:hypothetical protein
VAKKSSVFLRGLLKKVPADWRNSILRERVQIPTDLPPGVTFKIASTKKELEQSFRILHDAYVKVGLMKPHESGMRVSVYHALPTSIVLTAQIDGEVVGTVTVIRESALGLPSEKILDLSPLSKPGLQIAEISALAIVPKWRGKLFFPLLKYLYEMCVEVLNIDVFVVSVHSDWYFFYEALLCFSRIEDRVIDNYAFANNIPVVGEYLNLKHGYFEYARHYAHLPRDKNLFWYFTQHKIQSFDKRRSRFYSICNRAMTFETLNYFFNQRTDVFQALSPSEYWAIKNTYQSKEIDSLLKTPKEVSQLQVPTSRRYRRLAAYLKAVAVDDNGRQIDITVVEVSRGGMKVYLEREPEKTTHFLIAKVKLGDFDIPELSLERCWNKESASGLRLTNPNPIWESFIQYNENLSSDTLANVA